MSTSIEYIIPLPPVTKKNSQRILFNKNTGRPFVMPSKAYKDYEAAALSYLRPLPPEPIGYPVNVMCVFGMPNRRRTDLNNLLEAVTDILVKGGVLADDNYRIVAGHDGSRCKLAKVQPYTHIRITPMEEWLEELDGGGTP
nr:MAG TPA: Endodeoxyribonuclease RusA [Caudoviricetes sp.]